MTEFTGSDGLKYALTNNLLVVSTDSGEDKPMTALSRGLVDSTFDVTSATSCVLFNAASINEYAFVGCNVLATVAIPYPIPIGDGAFQGCTALTGFSIWMEQGNYISIGNGAFQGCTALTSIHFPSAYTTIGNSAFQGCTSLTSARVNGVTKGGNAMFAGCTALTSITIPSSLTQIPGEAFEGCTALTSVTFPDTLTHILFSAFKDCTSLPYLWLPRSTTFIGQTAFMGCTSMLTLYLLPETPPTLRDYAISESTTAIRVPYCAVDTYKTASVWERYASIIGHLGPYYDSNNNEYLINGVLLMVSKGENGTGVMQSFTSSSNVKQLVYPELFTKVTIGDGMTTVGSNAFYNNTTLTSAEVCNGVTVINGYAFYNCTALSSLYLTNDITSIASYAFTGCTQLRSVRIPNSMTVIQSNTFNNCTLLELAVIPGGITTISSNAFSGDTALTSITIPDTVTNIQSGAFVDNAVLYMLCTTPPTVPDGNTWTYYVSVLSKQAYLDAGYAESSLHYLLPGTHIRGSEWEELGCIWIKTATGWEATFEGKIKTDNGWKYI